MTITINKMQAIYKFQIIKCTIWCHPAESKDLGPSRNTFKQKVMRVNVTDMKFFANLRMT